MKAAANCGLIVGIVGVIVLLLPTYGVIDSQAGLLSFLLNVIEIAAFVYAIYYYKHHFATSVFTYGRGIKVALAIGLFYGIIKGLAQFLIFSFDMDVVARTVDLAKRQIAEMNLQPEVANQMLESMSIATNPWMLFFSQIFSSLIFALFVSLIAMIFLKEKEDYTSVMRDVE